jgi:hypothetical protein
MKINTQVQNLWDATKAVLRKNLKHLRPTLEKKTCSQAWQYMLVIPAEATLLFNTSLGYIVRLSEKAKSKAMRALQTPLSTLRN